jgi:hypothetical protein
MRDASQTALRLKNCVYFNCVLILLHSLALGGRAEYFWVMTLTCVTVEVSFYTLFGNILLPSVYTHGLKPL